MPRIRRSAATAAALLGLLGAAQADCPPPASQPTSEQMQAAVRAARDAGALWRLERDGRTSWLYGTIHVGRFEQAVPGPRTEQAVRDADELAVELNVLDPKTFEGLRAAADAAAAKAAKDPALSAAALSERIARTARAECVDPSALAAQHPGLRATTLAVVDARRAGLDARYAADFVLINLARSIDKPIVSLEAPEAQIDALLGGDDGPTQARRIGRALADIDSGKSRRTAERLHRAWLRGDLDDVAAYERWCDCVVDAADRAAFERLNDARNPALADAIAARHAAGKRVFAAVGLLHMTGPKALPKLLAERGFTVERVGLDAAPDAAASAPR